MNWTFEEVRLRAELYLKEGKTEEAARSLMSDLGKFKEGRGMLRSLSRPLMEVVAESDDTKLWRILAWIEKKGEGTNGGR